MAVLIEGQFVEIFLTPQTVGGGGNLICTAIHRALSRLFETHSVEENDPYISELYIQGDNCVGENTNHILLGYMGSLVGRGVVGRVEINFMTVGHTHILIDQVFSRLSVHCKGVDLFTRRQQADAFRDAYKELPVHTTTLRALGNFKDACLGGGRVITIPGISHPRAFELRPAGDNQVTVGMKESMHAPTFTGKTAAGVYEGEPRVLFRGGLPLVEEAPPFELKTVDPTAIKYIRQRYK
ncbi:unnamed protein product, partial [Sphacelaria rigidula]